MSPPSAWSVSDRRSRAELPAAAVALRKAKPKLVPMTRHSVSSKSPVSRAPIAVTAAIVSAPTRAQPSARRISARSMPALSAALSVS